MASVRLGNGHGPSLGTGSPSLELPTPGGIIDLREFSGVDRTGNSPSTTALRNAVTEAGALAASASGYAAQVGAIVRVPPGRYLLDGKIQLPDGTGIAGAGPYRGTAFYYTGTSFADNCVFENSVVDGTQEAIYLSGFALYGHPGTASTVNQPNSGVATTVATAVPAGSPGQYMSFTLNVAGSISAYPTNGTLLVGASNIRVVYNGIDTVNKNFLGCVVVSGLGTVINIGDSVTPVTTDNVSAIHVLGLAGPTFLRDIWLSAHTAEGLLIANTNAIDCQNIVSNYSNRDCILYTGARASNYFRAIAGQYSGVPSDGRVTAGFHIQGQHGLHEFAGLISLDGFYSEQTSQNAIGLWLDNIGSFSGQNINLQGGVAGNFATQTGIKLTSSGQATPLTQDGTNSANISLRNIACGQVGRVLLNDTIRGFSTPANTTTVGTTMTRYDTEDASPRTKATPTYSASITPDCTQGDWQTITVTNTTAFTINAPTTPPGTTQTRELVIEVLNSSGGAMGVITWNAAFVFAGLTWTNPASTKKRYARFQWNGSAWIAQSIAAADY